MFHLEKKIQGEIRGAHKNSLIFMIINYLTNVAKMDRFVVRRQHAAVEELVFQTTDQPSTDSVTTAEQPPSSNSLERVEAPAK